MTKDRVTVQQPTTTVDDEGIVKQSWSDVVQLEGTLLPYGNERALREYGFSETVTYRFFYKGTHDALKVGNRIVHNGVGMPIVYVANYGKAMDVLLDTSNESSS